LHDTTSHFPLIAARLLRKAFVRGSKNGILHDTTSHFPLIAARLLRKAFVRGSKKTRLANVTG